MALKQNTALLGQLPIRLIGGSPGTFRALWGGSSLRNATVGQGITSQLAGIPSGHLAPSSWNLPNKPGAMSAFTSCVVSTTLDALNLAAGRNVEGGAAVTITLDPAQGQLIVSASGNALVSFTIDAALAGALSASGTAAVSVTVNDATLGALVEAVGALLVQVSADATARATGNLVGNITPFTELSPQSLADAVWNKVLP